MGEKAAAERGSQLTQAGPNSAAELVSRVEEQGRTSSSVCDPMAQSGSRHLTQSDWQAFPANPALQALEAKILVALFFTALSLLFFTELYPLHAQFYFLDYNVSFSSSFIYPSLHILSRPIYDWPLH